MSNSKMFSEFLVEQNLVSADDLVSILINQTKAMPTLAEIARDQTLLTAEQILSVFTRQMQSGGDFSKACQDLNLWSPEMAKAFSAENDRLRIPVVQILQSTGKVSTEKLVLALDTYLSESARPSVVAASPTPSVTPISASLSPPAVESNESMDHFREFYTQDIQAKMITLARGWDQSELDITNALIDRVHGIVGAARFAKLGEIEELFKNTESNIRALADCATPLPMQSIEAFRVELCQAFEKGWELRGADPAGSFEQSEVAV